ncbi:MAG: YigZ family protein [Lachnospiraceae bacterium]|nr:YigZ family protein [Lachnospiraceae bacterium]MEE3458147.1 YigZ family protein [Lachnospiraceae bacterium]
MSRTVLVPGVGEVVEKKSRFIGEIFPAETLEEAEERLLAIRKRYYDARHHCFAAVVGVPGTPEEIRRGNDDGEPGGTAGKPMLEVLDGEDLHNTAVVVTRYFGGTLLGTGGLVRAYSAAVKAAIANAAIVTVVSGRKIAFRVSYSDAGKLQYLYAKEGIEKPEIAYGQDVVMTLKMRREMGERIKKITAETTNGAAVLLLDEACVYTV